LTPSFQPRDFDIAAGDRLWARWDDAVAAEIQIRRSLIMVKTSPDNAASEIGRPINNCPKVGIGLRIKMLESVALTEMKQSRFKEERIIAFLREHVAGSQA
jgi:hypothetical protein